MLCFNIIGNIACVQITGEIQNFISALLKVFKTFVKQLIIIGFETDFAVRLQECFVHFKLFVVCKSALLCFALGHGLQKLMKSLSILSSAVMILSSISTLYFTSKRFVISSCVLPASSKALQLFFCRRRAYQP